MLNALLKRLFRTLGYSVRRVENTQYFDFESLLYFTLGQVREFQFAQVGACDGKTFDPIYPFVTKHHRRLRGVVIEPLPDLFQQLQANYRSYPSIAPCRCAIHHARDSAVIYRVDPKRLPEAPDWAIGISSLDPTHHRRSGIPSEWIVAETVECRRLPAVDAESGLESLHLLQIDAEGYDAELLLNLDYARLSPWIIRFEHGLQQGTMRRKTFDQLLHHLHAHHYEVHCAEADAVAIHHRLIFPGSAAEESAPA